MGANAFLAAPCDQIRYVPELRLYQALNLTCGTIAAYVHGHHLNTAVKGRNRQYLPHLRCSPLVAAANAEKMQLLFASNFCVLPADGGPIQPGNTLVEQQRPEKRVKVCFQTLICCTAIYTQSHEWTLRLTWCK